MGKLERDRKRKQTNKYFLYFKKGMRCRELVVKKERERQRDKMTERE